MNLKHIFQNRWFKVATLSIAGLLVILLSFSAGVHVGYRKAGFSEGWGDNYHRNFAGPNNGFNGFMGDLRDREYLESSGTFGQILKIDGQAISVKSREGVEKTILVDEKTEIRRFRDTVKLADLKADDFIVTIGEPNDAGQIVAKLIRVMPAPPQNGPAADQAAPGQLPPPPDQPLPPPSQPNPAPAPSPVIVTPAQP